MLTLDIVRLRDPMSPGPPDWARVALCGERSELLLLLSKAATWFEPVLLHTMQSLTVKPLSPPASGRQWKTSQPRQIPISCTILSYIVGEPRPQLAKGSSPFSPNSVFIFSPQFLAMQTQRSRAQGHSTQSQSRYFELDLSPILEDAWVFAGKSPTLGLGNLAQTTTTSTVASGSLGPAFSIDSCLGVAGAGVQLEVPDPQGDHDDNQMTTKAQPVTVPQICTSSGDAFTQSSSMSCSSFGELLDSEKVRFSFDDAWSFGFDCKPFA